MQREFENLLLQLRQEEPLGIWTCGKPPWRFLGPVSKACSGQNSLSQKFFRNIVGAKR